MDLELTTGFVAGPSIRYAVYVGLVHFRNDGKPIYPIQE